jgi:predicted peroxiredoxin
MTQKETVYLLKKYIKNLNSKALKDLEDVYYDALNMGIKWSSQTKYKNVEFNISGGDDWDERIKTENIF